MELMIVVAIIGILASIAIPSYAIYVIRGHRSAAMGQMMDIANREQQYFQATRAYADTATLTSNGYSLPSEVAARYTWNVVPGTGTVPTYLITFTATGPQASDGNLTLDQAGTKTPAEKWKR